MAFAEQAVQNVEFSNSAVVFGTGEGQHLPPTIVAYPYSIFMVLTVGYVMCRKGYMQEYIVAQTKRNPYWDKAKAYYDELLREIRSRK